LPQQARRPFDVREEEGDGAGRKPPRHNLMIADAER
jgi:hypothetical protein